MAPAVCVACQRKFEIQLQRLNDKLYCVDCFNVAKSRERAKDS